MIFSDERLIHSYVCLKYKLWVRINESVKTSTHNLNWTAIFSDFLNVI